MSARRAAARRFATELDVGRERVGLLPEAVDTGGQLTGVRDVQQVFGDQGRGVRRGRWQRTDGDQLRLRGHPGVALRRQHPRRRAHLAADVVGVARLRAGHGEHRGGGHDPDPHAAPGVPGHGRRRALPFGVPVGQRDDVPRGVVCGQQLVERPGPRGTLDGRGRLGDHGRGARVHLDGDGLQRRWGRLPLGGVAADRPAGHDPVGHAVLGDRDGLRPGDGDANPGSGGRVGHHQRERRQRPVHGDRLRVVDDVVAVGVPVVADPEGG